MLPGLTPQQRQYLYEGYEDEFGAYYVYEQEVERAKVYAELGGFPPNKFIKEESGC